MWLLEPALPIRGGSMESASMKAALLGDGMVGPHTTRPWTTGAPVERFHRRIAAVKPPSQILIALPLPSIRRH